MSWPYPTSTEILEAPPGAVDLWRAQLADVPPATHGRLLRLLSPSERARGRRCGSAESRHTFEVARGILRSILSRYLTLPPERIRFDVGPGGKPRLAAGSWRFNLSHAHGLAIFAVARERELGVDLERIRPELKARVVAERFFTPAEVAALEALPEREATEAFFTIWTCKEAYLKARGSGLTKPLDSVTVTLGPGREPHLSNAAGDACGWSLHTLKPADGYAAAVALMGNDVHIRYWSWQPGQPAEPGRERG